MWPLSSRGHSGRATKIELFLRHTWDNYWTLILIHAAWLTNMSRQNKMTNLADKKKSIVKMQA